MGTADCVPTAKRLMSKQNQSRAVQTRGASRAGVAVMAAPMRRIASLVRIENAGWSRVSDLDKPTEECVLTAVLSDGRRIERTAQVTYAAGERERLLEAVLSGNGTEADVRVAQDVLHRRAKAVENVRGDLQREFGRGVPWVDAEAVAL